ncbi:ABC transporter permease [Acuticoccus sp. I52.16.1]|uniref:ABC transporter permease n=1 Tax=Acuticoccus sp. I52.16.1 TaxID=2928472 RepID=UPI001FD3E73E|nr:ABC transporter permease subunit [Acuticoccus sp. I52.16.1]UOM35838.1 ABC transporter permease subunit [Acuticoccus sp. I52.16.1]
MSGDGGVAAPRRRHLDRALRTILPILVLCGVIYLWDWTVRVNEIPPYILPAPGLVLRTLVDEWALLAPSLATTLAVTVAALALAVVGGVLLAIVLTQSRIIEYSIFPIAVVVQVTPIVAVFPLINIYIDNHLAKILLCAWIIAFFPILSNTTLGLMSADRNLKDLYRLYGASRWQTLRHLLLPAALPYFLGGLRISGGLALVGAVVAEFVAGTSGFGSGLATRIIEAGYQLKIPRLFAALGLISMTGVAIYVILSIVSNLILGRWHESAMEGRR